MTVASLQKLKVTLMRIWKSDDVIIGLCSKHSQRFYITGEGLSFKDCSISREKILLNDVA